MLTRRFSGALTDAAIRAGALFIFLPMVATAQPEANEASDAASSQVTQVEATGSPVLLGGGMEAGPKGESLNFFNSLLRAAQLGALIDVPPHYTLIAPSDRAFRALAPERLSDMIHRPDGLRDLLAAHIVPGHVAVRDLRPGATLRTLDGNVVELSAAPNAVLLNQAELLASAETDVGVVHVVDRLL